MLVPTLLFLLQGCPDPTTAADLGNPGPGGAQPGAADGPGPQPGSAGQGPPPQPGEFDVSAEGGVTISGMLTYDGSETGQVRLDFLRTEGDGPPHLLHVEKLDALGAFSMQVPSNTGPVTIVAFVDIDDDGPSTSDPAGLVQLAIEEAPLANVSIALIDSPDLGALTPGNEPPPGTEPTGAAPEEPEVLMPTGDSPDAEAEIPPAAATETPTTPATIDPPVVPAVAPEPTEVTDSE